MSDRWLREVELEHDTVRLVPMRMEHADELVRAASDGELWNLWFTSVPNAEGVEEYIRFALSEYEAGRSLPFTVINKDTNEIIGSTRFCNAEPPHRRAEIGYTWYAKSHQRSAVNTECKFLMLSHAFEDRDAIAVEFRTHWHNHRSRRAISRLGAKQDGVLRNHQILPDGSYRDTVVFSITKEEWPAVKTGLERFLD